MRSVVITGGTRGLGLRLAENFRKRGFNIAICGTKESSVEKALTHLRSIQGDGKLLGECCNVSDPANVRSFAFHVKEVFGSIDIWINNAGVNRKRSIIYTRNCRRMSSVHGSRSSIAALLF